MTEREAHIATCADAYELSISTADGWESIIRDCACALPESPATCETP